MSSTDNQPAEITRTDHPELSPRRPIYFLGAILVALLALVVSYSELVVSRGGSVNAILLGATHLPAGALAFLLLILGANSLLHRFFPKLALRPHEITLLYSMLIVTALMSSFSYLAQVMPTLAGINYFGSPENKWEDLLYGNLRQWLVPWDVGAGAKQPFIRDYYEGLFYGQPIPYTRWLPALGAWSIFALALYGLMACLSVLIRKQWVDNEKLSFPLVQLPLEMIKDETRPSFFRNRLMWIGFGIPFVIHAINGFHQFFPAVPQLTLIYTLNQYFTTKPWNQMQIIFIIFSFAVIGLGFLLPRDVGFSFWFFFLFARLQDVIASFFGAEMGGMPVYPAYAYIGYQSVGASIVVGLGMLWLGRSNFKGILKGVWPKREQPDSSAEVMTYRKAFWGAVLSLAIMVTWLSLAGMSWQLGLALMLIFLFFVVLPMTRSVSEIGLLMLQGLFRPIDVINLVMKRSALGPRNLTVMSLVDGIFYRDPRIIMPALLDGQKMAGETRLAKRHLLPGLITGVLVTLVVGGLFQLHLVYRHGGINCNSWFLLSNPTLYFNESVGLLTGREKFSFFQLGWASAGAAFTVFLYFMRARFWWWPFHPLAYALAPAWPGIVYWFSYFLGWLARTFLQKYGGIKVYRRSRALFLGLILGEFSAALVWGLVSAITGVPAPYIPLV